MPSLGYSDENGGQGFVVVQDGVGGAAPGLSSVETLVIPDRESANDPAVMAEERRCCRFS